MGCCYNTDVRYRSLHPWDVTPAQALEIQRQLALQVSIQAGLLSDPHLVAGVDLSAPDPQGVAYGAAVVVSLPTLEVVEVKRACARVTFPYIPGLLSFREAPILLAALERLTTSPDVIMVDGQGLAHPRRFGLACHVGLLADAPAIGCAKSILRGKFVNLGTARGSVADLVDNGEVVGAAVRTRDGISPIYVSVGHRVDLPGAIRCMLACCAGYRMPEPTRLAHQAAAGRLAEREPVSSTEQRREQRGRLDISSGRRAYSE